MATLRQLPSGKWQAQIKLAGKPAKSSTHPTKEAAEAWVADCERVNKIDLLEIPKLFAEYLQTVMILNEKKRGGYEAIFYKLQNLEQNLTVKRLESLTPENVAEYRQERLKAVSGSTVRLEMQLLSRVLRWAASEKGIACKDVVQGVKLPEAGKARSKIIEPIEYSMILGNASVKAKPVIELAWHTAMIRNEILAITSAMVDFTKRVINLSDEQTKNGEGRAVPLNKAAVALLTALCDGRDKNARLFAITPYGITKAFRRSARLSGVHGVCFHSLRHSAITRYAEMGLNTIQLQAISGHKSITMLARYSHIKV